MTALFDHARSGEDVRHPVPMDVRETNVTTTKTVTFSADRMPTSSGDAVHVAALYASPSQPYREGHLVVIPTVGFGSMRCAAELSGPNHQCLLQ
jgi:hypothetical protein